MDHFCVHVMNRPRCLAATHIHVNKGYLIFYHHYQLPARAGHFLTEKTEPTRTEPNCRFFGLFGSVSVFIFVRFGGRLRLRFSGSTEPNNRFGGAQSKQLRCASEQPTRCGRERAGQRPPKRASERSTGVTWASSSSG